MSRACEILHQRLRELPRRRWQLPMGAVPKGGIYVVFEKGEKAHGGDRIVRVGTHTGEDNLAKRLREHAFPPYRSIFRRHLGRCLLARDGASVELIRAWGLPITSAADKAKNLAKRSQPRLKTLDAEIDAYITKKLTFVAFEVKGDRVRTDIEKAMLATVAQCEDCGPSARWLGGHFPAWSRKRFAETGLWNVVGLRGKPMTATEASRLPLGRKAV